MMQKMLIIVLTLFFATSAYAACEMDNRTLTVSNCPEDVKKFIERVASCNHLSGEHTGGQYPDQDKFVEDALLKQDCANGQKAYDDLNTLVTKYRVEYKIHYGFMKTLNDIDPTYVYELLTAYHEPSES